MNVRTSLAIACATIVSTTAPAVAQNVAVRGVDSLRVRMNMQGQLNTTSVDEEPSTEWLVRRARVGFRAWAAGWIRADIEADFGDGDAELTDGYVRLDFDRAGRFQVGQFKKPFDALELTSSRELLVVERGGAPRGAGGFSPNDLVGDLGFSGRDVGGQWHGAFGRASADLGVWNGVGSNASEDDDGKQIGARVGVEVVPGWQAVGAWSGLRVSDPVVEDDPTWFHAAEVAVVGGAYGQPGWKGLAQAMTGDNHDPEVGGGPDATFLALQAIVVYHVPVYRVPYVIGVEPAVRVGWTDPDTDVDDDEATLWTAGVNVYHHERVKTQLGLDALTPAEDDTEVAFRLHVVLGF